jgi:hypothetical protein
LKEAVKSVREGQRGLDLEARPIEGTQGRLRPLALSHVVND